MQCSKVHPRKGHEGLERDYMYSSTLSLTSALDVSGWSKPLPGRTLPPGNTRYPLYIRLGGSQGRSEQVREISPPTGNRSPDCPARSESLYRLSYSGPPKSSKKAKIFTKEAKFPGRINAVVSPRSINTVNSEIKSGCYGQPAHPIN